MSESQKKAEEAKAEPEKKEVVTAKTEATRKAAPKKERKSVV